MKLIEKVKILEELRTVVEELAEPDHSPKWYKDLTARRQELESKLDVKLCGKCKRSSKEVAFGRTRRSSDGLQAWCKECMKRQRKTVFGVYDGG